MSPFDVSIQKGFLWALLVFGLFLFGYAVRKPPMKEWLIVFFLTSYFSTFFGVIVVENDMVTYPIGLFDNYFDTSPLYEFLLLPVVSIFYCQTTSHASWSGILRQGIGYTTVLTAGETILERYTNLVHYNSWTWQSSYVSIFALLFAVRVLLAAIRRREQSESRG
ncbi:MAG TPA: CBO0543 family protein [Bacillales bacterium]|nr:CBO0543 family protein [Bacillales bacterium]